MNVSDINIHVFLEVMTIYRIEQNFGGEKTLANLANRHNLPSFFCQHPDEARKCRQPLDSPKFFRQCFKITISPNFFTAKVLFYTVLMLAI